MSFFHWFVAGFVALVASIGGFLGFSHLTPAPQVVPSTAPTVTATTTVTDPFVALNENLNIGNVYLKNSTGIYVKDFSDVSPVILKVQGADLNTFVFVTSDSLPGGSYFVYGKDKNHAYQNADILTGIDGASFSYIGSVYFVDKDYVYLLNTNENAGTETLSIIDGADPHTFKIFDCPLGGQVYGQDTNHFYFWGKTITSTSTACAI